MGTAILSYCKKLSLLLLVTVSIVLISYCPHGLNCGLSTNKRTEAESSSVVFHPKIVRKVKIPETQNIAISENLSLPKDVIDNVKKFVFFVGHPRSGHSIVGSFMDAHPHMVIAHEFMLFSRLSKTIPFRESTTLNSKADLFNALYSHSAYDSTSGWRSKEENSKNYTLSVESLWQGTYDRYISIIGDKSGGKTSNAYVHSPEDFKTQYRQLQEMIGIPIKVIYCVRNPYDLISTSALYDKGARTRSVNQNEYVSLFKSRMRKLEGEEFMKARFDDEKILESRVNKLQNESKAVVEITNLVGPDNVLEIHNTDLVRDPNKTLTKLCIFLEVECPPNYIQACSAMVFRSVFKSRELVVWTQRLQRMVQEIIQTYSFFNRYSFTSD